MKPDELEHIRADIRAAMVEAQWEDRTLLPELLDRLLSAVGEVADAGTLARDFGLLRTEGETVGFHYPHAQEWAANLLRQCQLRAVSKIPFPEVEPDDDRPHWSEHL